MSNTKILIRLADIPLSEWSQKEIKLLIKTAKTELRVWTLVLEEAEKYLK
ncbi:MAG: hypothetical protein WC764_04300 [Candidatus Paceibacterota bacterium]